MIYDTSAYPINKIKFYYFDLNGQHSRITNPMDRAENSPILEQTKFPPMKVNHHD